MTAGKSWKGQSMPWHIHLQTISEMSSYLDLPWVMVLHWFLSLTTNAGPQPPSKLPSPPHPMGSWESLRAQVSTTNPWHPWIFFSTFFPLFLILSVFWALHSSPYSPGYHHCTLRAPPSPAGIICFTGHFSPFHGHSCVPPALLCHHGTLVSKCRHTGLPYQGRVRVR